MKKLFGLAALTIVILMMFSGCGGDSGGTIDDYSPFLANTLYIYEGEGHSMASYNSYNTLIRGSRAQRMFQSTSGEYTGATTEVLEKKDGELRFINGDPYYYHFEDMTKLEPSRDVLVLKEPLTRGAEWNRDAHSVSKVTGIDVSVTVPAGQYKALEVTTTNSEGQVTKDYYAKGVGLVKTEYTMNDKTVSSSLSQIVEDTPMTALYNYLFPDPETGAMSIARNTIDFHTNYNYVDVINQALTTPHPLGLYEPLVSESVFVNAGVSYTSFTAHVDFAKNVYNYTFANENEERIFVHCLALVTGGLLAADEVVVLVEGEPYSGRFFTQNLDEPFITNVQKLADMLQEEADE